MKSVFFLITVFSVSAFSLENNLLTLKVGEGKYQHSEHYSVSSVACIKEANNFLKISVKTKNIKREDLDLIVFHLPNAHHILKGTEETVLLQSSDTKKIGHNSVKILTLNKQSLITWGLDADRSSNSAACAVHINHLGNNKIKFSGACDYLTGKYTNGMPFRGYENIDIPSQAILTCDIK